jgi:nitrite reductase/ring-hydroxylating ferredoxin subunit
MAGADGWTDVGAAAELAATPLQRIAVGNSEIALSFRDGSFGAVANACNHAGGPLGEGCLDSDYIVCPWHHWKFHRVSGVGEPGFEEDRVPSFPVKVENGRVLVNLRASTRRTKKPHPPHPLARPVARAPGPLRLAGISTTVMEAAYPRFSGSDHLLGRAVEAAAALGAEARLIRLNELKFRACEGYYSKAAGACTWPCSITQMDADDGLTPVYEVLVHWADAVIIATPIRWGNIQAVAGQMLGFFAELGFIFPQFPYIAHSRGWSHEDMEANVAAVRDSTELAEGAAELSKRLLDLAAHLLARDEAPASIERGGRKANPVW